jgi:uncharacterized damage-inducible protein DinB
MSNSYSTIVSQAIDLLDGMSITEYQKQLPPHFPSSVGAHMRHVIDHFLALMNGHNEGHVDYNKRHRFNAVEQFPAEAIECFESIVTWLNNLADNILDTPITVTTEIDVSRTHSTTCNSTLERELVFASSHAIHHYALIRIICSMQNKPIPEFFGYAPATITHITKSA